MNIIKSRNSFVGLCEYASQKNWCWKLWCTTCGHQELSVGLLKIAYGLNPDCEEFLQSGISSSHVHYSRNGIPSLDIQEELARCVASASLEEIRKVSKYPDWLGYVGLAINHCSSYSARKIISDSYLPQFILMFDKNIDLQNYLREKQSKGELLNIEDLSIIENKC